VLVLAGSLHATPSRAEPIVANRIVAVVGGEPITLTALRRAARPQLLSIERGKAPAWEKAREIRRTLRRTLDELIERTLVAYAAESAHIKVEDAEVNRAIEALAAERHVTRADLMITWLTDGYSEEYIVKEYRGQILERRVIDRAYAQTHEDQLVWGPGDADVRRAQAFRASWYATMREALSVEVRFTEVDRP
jgi:hypothetical protein